ncbi:MAG: 30S ribosomal protein S16 [Actinomycetales bacterium]
MAVKIKLKRLGKIHAPQYRIVVADARTARNGRAIEELGIYQPMDNPSVIQVNSERVQYWLGVGAQPTESVQAILRVTGDWQKFKGLPGAEGTLQVAPPKPSKLAAYEAAVKEAATEPKSAKPKAKAKDAEAELEAALQTPPALTPEQEVAAELAANAEADAEVAVEVAAREAAEGVAADEAAVEALENMAEAARDEA